MRVEEVKVISDFFFNLNGTIIDKNEQNQVEKWLSDSGITIEEAIQLGWKAVKDQKEVKKKLRYSPETNLSFKIAVEIPYKDEGGDCLFSRFRFFPEVKIGKKTAKYLGPKGQKPLPYIPKETIQKKKKFKEELWITEGEKKALRLVKEGKASLGIQGVWNFGKKKEESVGKIFSIFSEIKEYIGGGREVILAFDSDCRRNSRVLLALLTLAFLLQKENAKVYIAKWDESDGKGIDDFLARKKLDELQKIWLPRAIEPQNKQEVIGAMRRAKVSDSQIFEWVSMGLGISKEDLINEVKGKSKTKFWEDFEEKITKAETGKDFREIANFIAEIEAQYIDDDGKVTWKLNLIGRKSVAIEIKGEEIVSLTRFKESLGSGGPFLYRVSSNNLHCDFLSYLMEKGFTEVRTTQFLGRVKKDMFLFSNMVVTSKGPEEISNLIPPKSRMLYQPGGKLKEIVKNFIACYGEERAWKIFGFAVGTLFVKEISEYYGFFPLLFLNGDKGSGKSKLAELITWLFGAVRELRPFNFNSTSKAIQRIMSQFKGVPITLNEYQSDPTKNNRLILSIYDREGYQRAKKDNSLETISGVVESTCMVISTQNPSGEESEAILSRMIEIGMDFDKGPEERKAFNWLWTNRETFSCFVSHCMKEIHPNGLLTMIKEVIKTREQEGLKDQRMIENYSILESCSLAFFSSLNLEEFQPKGEEIDQEIRVKIRELKDCSVLSSFFNALDNLITKEDPVVKKWIKENGPEFYFSLPKVYPEVRKYHNQAKLPIPDQKTIARMLKAAGYEQKAVRFEGDKGTPKKAWIINSLDYQ